MSQWEGHLGLGRDDDDYDTYLLNGVGIHGLKMLSTGI